MSKNSFFQSLKNVFWFQSASDDRHEDPIPSTDTYDVFFKVDEAPNYENELKELKPWIKEEFEDPKIVLNDPDVMEEYIDLSLDVETKDGDFRLVYYENDELILRGDRELVPDIEDSVEKQLELEFERV